MALAVTHDGQRVVSAGGEGALRSWDLQVAKTQGGHLGHPAKITTVASSADGARLLSGDEAGFVFLWDARVGSKSPFWVSDNGQINALAFTDDSRYLSAGAAGRLSLWQTADKPVFSLSAEPLVPFRCAAQTPIGLLALAGGGWTDEVENGLTLYRLPAVQPKLILPGLEFDLAALASDGQTALLVGDQPNLQKLATGELPVILTGTISMPSIAVLSPGGHWAAVGDLDGIIWVWELQSKRLFTLKDHDKYVGGLAFTPDDRYLFSGGWDGALRLWDLTLVNLVARYQWGLPIECCTTAADGASIFAAAGDAKGNILFFEIVLSE